MSTIAQFPSRCTLCGDQIDEGDEIASCEGEWCHAECVEDWEESE